MAVSILDIDDLESNDFNIIAIHTSLEDYKLAYLINKHCQIKLTKELIPLTLSKFDISTSFDFFTFHDHDERIIWSLISNKSILSSKCYYTESLLLHEKKTFSDIILIPECDSVDFFLKVEEEIEPHLLINILNQIQVINKIDAVYELNKNALVSINNLLF